MYIRILSKLYSYEKFILKILSRILMTSFFTIFLLACSKITQNNFEKIKPNMSMQEVVTLLGEPSSSESIMIVGISGTSAVWKDEQAEIDIQFLNNKVTVKSFSKLTESQTHR